MPRVLVVDDYADSREAMMLLLQRAGYEVSAAGDGRKALALVLENLPDVVLLDLAMPEMDGVKLVQLLRSYHRLSAIPVVLLTGLTAGRLFEEAKALNVSSLLLKSLATTSQVIPAIRKALAEPLSGARMHLPEKWRANNISPL
jgi:CheY-like chemotaxis protein